jgi:hypothetical protein
MASAWEDPIRNSSQLTVFPTAALIRSFWSPIFTQSIAEFNRLSTAQRLGVTLVKSATAPDPDTDAGANIQVDVAGGRARARGLGVDIDESFSPTSVHGLTKVLSRSFGNGPDRVVKCFVFVPSKPTGNAPSGARVIGDGVKLFILVHEFVHAAGQLNNAEHSPESNPDVFIGTPIASPQLDVGSTPAGDRVRVGAPPNFTRFPPITMSARVAGLIRANWP